MNKRGIAIGNRDSRLNIGNRSRRVIRGKRIRRLAVRRLRGRDAAILRRGVVVVGPGRSTRQDQGQDEKKETGHKEKCPLAGAAGSEGTQAEAGDERENPGDAQEDGGGGQHGTAYSFLTTAIIRPTTTSEATPATTALPTVSAEDAEP